MTTPAQDGKAKARILLVDDHPLLREALAQLVNRQSDLICCGEAGTRAEAMQAMATLQPDAVVLDLRLKDADGLELIKAFKAQFPQTHILILSQFEETMYAERTLRAGALGYVMKEQTAEEILNALRAVVSGEIHVSPAMTTLMLRKVLATKRPPAANVENLTDRELHVLQLLGASKSTRDIAEELHLSVKTIETYREHLKYKLNLHNSAELVQYARRWVEGQFKSGLGATSSLHGQLNNPAKA